MQKVVHDHAQHQPRVERKSMMGPRKCSLDDTLPLSNRRRDRKKVRKKVLDEARYLLQQCKVPIAQVGKRLKLSRGLLR
jgi:hypothetical protein